MGTFWFWSGKQKILTPQRKKSRSIFSENPNQNSCVFGSDRCVCDVYCGQKKYHLWKEPRINKKAIQSLMRSSIRHPLQSIRLRQQPHIKRLGASAVPKRIPNTPNQVLSISGAAILRKGSIPVRSYPMRIAQYLYHE